MNNKLNILILHQMGIPYLRRKAVEDLEFMLPNYAPEHNYIVHDCEFDFPSSLKEASFDAIILGPTFLCNRYTPKRYKKTLQMYDFIKNSTAYKIAMPQDDYDCSEILDNWMVNWKVNFVYTVLPEHIDILYPNYIQFGGILEKAYTGYISDELVSQWSNTKKFEEREIDVSYRAAMLPANFGELGNIKGVIAQRFIDATKKYNLKLDISTSSKDMIPGTKWHSFIENSKFCLVTNSGSSLLDKKGTYRELVNSYMYGHIRATFEEIREACFPNEDNKYQMTAISPRNIEAILANTVQIAVEGEYSGLLKPYEHYIPLKSDCSNIEEVIFLMKNTELVKKMAKDTKEMILNTKELYYSTHVDEIIENLKYKVSKKNINRISIDDFDNYKKIYIKDVESKTNLHWKIKYLEMKIKNIAKQLGVKHLLEFAKYYKKKLS